MNKKSRQITALLLAIILIGMQPLWAVYAVAEEAGSICTCAVKCRDGLVDESCLVCHGDHEGESHGNIAACLGKETGSEEPVMPDMPQENDQPGDVKNFDCICDILCEDGYRNLNCLICSIFFATECVGKSPEGPVCRCELRCEEGNSNAGCQICSSGDFSQCRGIVCSCDVLCSNDGCVACANGAQCKAGVNKCTCILSCRDEVNADCPLCGLGDISQCNGAVCTCFYQCAGEFWDSNCPVCEKDLHLCSAQNVLPPCTCQVPCEPGVSYGCDTCAYGKGQGCQAPQCTCIEDAYVCTFGNRNPSCSVCQYDRQACRFTGCVCFLFASKDCTESDFMSECPICSRDPEKCLYFPIACSDFNNKIMEVPEGYEFRFKVGQYPINETIVVGQTIGMCEDPYYAADYREVSAAPQPELGDSPMIRVKNGGNLTIHDFILDGSKEIYSSRAPMIYVEKGGVLNLGSRCVLRNSQNINGAAAVYVEAGGTLRITGDAQIINNESALEQGAVYCESGAFVEMSGNAGIYGNTGNDLVLTGDSYIDISQGMGNNARVFVYKESEGPFARKDFPPDYKDIRSFFSSTGENVIQKGNELYFSSEEKDCLTGRVFLSGRLVQNAKVTVKDMADGTVLSAVTTDREGSYKIPMLDLNQYYRIIVTAKINGKSYAAVADKGVKKEQDKFIFEGIALKEGYAVSGSVSGQASINAQVKVMDMSGGVIAQDTVYGRSGYDVIIPAAGDYPVILENGDYSGSGFIRLEGSGQASGTSMSIDKGILAAGTILDTEGKPAVGATVTMVRDTKGRSAVHTTPAATALTNAKGQYIVGGLDGSGVYEAVVISEAVKGYNTVGGLIIQNNKVMNGRENTLALKPTYSVKGTLYYVKTFFQFLFPNYYIQGPEYPKNIMLELSTDNGVEITRVPVNPQDGSFILPAIFDGAFQAAIVSSQDKNVRLDSSQGAFIIKEGKITCSSRDRYFTTDEKEAARLGKDNGVRVNPGDDFKVIWDIMLKYNRWDLETEITADLFGELSRVYEYLAGCNAIERDMMINQDVDMLNALIKKVADKYKVTVSTNNMAQNIVKRVMTSLGNGSQVSDVAETIAGSIGTKQELPENSQIDICLDISTASQAEKRMLEEASLSGEIIQIFDMTLEARYSEGEKSGSGKKGEQAITQLPEEIQVEVELEGFTHEKDRKYVILRSHKNPDTGMAEISVLETEYMDGKLYFNTDRFSSYAVAYASPDEGVVIEAVSPETPDSAAGGGSGPDGGPSSPEIVLPDNGDGEKEESSEDKLRPDKYPSPQEKNPGKTDSYTSKKKNISGKQDSKSGKKKKDTDVISDKYDEQYKYWLDVYNQINAALDGDTIIINAGDYSAVPSMIMEALYGRDVTLVIENNNGETIIVNGLNLSINGTAPYTSFDELKQMENNPSKEKVPAAQLQDNAQEEGAAKEESLPYPFGDGISVIANAADFGQMEKADGFGSRAIATNRNITKGFMVLAVFGGTILFSFPFLRRK